MNFQVLCCDISIHINIRNDNLLLIKALLQKPAPNWIDEIGQKHRKSKFPHRESNPDRQGESLLS